MDVLLVGGGLANALVALRLLRERPEVRFTVLEAGPTLGGDHTWCFHGTDVEGDWLLPLVARSWAAHDVALPGVERRIPGSYHALRSPELHARLAPLLGERLRLGTRVRDVGATHVVLGDGTRLEAGVVLDARGFAGAPAWPCGWQSFVGLDLTLREPHGLDAPLLIDGRVEQPGAWRFVYVLPWDEHRLLVEDTYYTDNAELDADLVQARIRTYCAERGWHIAQVDRVEAAALPIPLGGAAPVLERPRLGVAAGFFHATTGYSVPMAAANAVWLAAQPDLAAATLGPALAARARDHWAEQGFYRMLNRMLFRGAVPSERVRIFASFYLHPDATIARFYAGRLTAADKLRVLARGAPTVPALRAMRAAFSGD